MDTATELMRGGEYEVASANILKLGSRSILSAYDGDFVALSKDLGVPLVTVDQQVLTEFPGSVVSLHDFVGK